jgi:mercuric ion binding protein
MKKLTFTLFFIALLGLFNSCKNETVPNTTPIKIAKKAIKPENLTTVSLKIEGMTCEIGCAKLIESKLSETEGVAEAKVSFEDKVATIKFDKTIQSKTGLAEKISKVGGGDLYKVVE